MTGWVIAPVSDGIKLAAEERREFTEDELDRARLSVCAHAQSSDEAKEFMKMLGLIE